MAKKKRQNRPAPKPPAAEPEGPSFFVGELVHLKGCWFIIEAANSEKLMLACRGLRRNGKPREEEPVEGFVRVDVPLATANKLAEAGLKAQMDAGTALQTAVDVFADVVFNPPPMNVLKDIQAAAQMGSPETEAHVKGLMDVPGVKELATLEEAARRGVGVIHPVTPELAQAIQRLTGGRTATPIERFLSRPGATIPVQEAMEEIEGAGFDPNGVVFTDPQTILARHGHELPEAARKMLEDAILEGAEIQEDGSDRYANPEDEE